MGVTFTSFNEDCPADPTWLPAGGGPPPPVRMEEPAPHPDSECPFYSGAYQNFLIITHPAADGSPDILRYPTIADAFTTSYPTAFVRNSGTGDTVGDANSPDPCNNPGGFAAAQTVRQGAPTGKAWLGAVRQAGFRNIAIDQNHHTLYYGLHMNQAFVDFVQTNHLDTVAGLTGGGLDPNLAFPPGVAEFKTAWTDIDPRDFPDANGKFCNPKATVPPPTSFSTDPGDYSNYITAMAWVPWLTPNTTTGTLDEDPDHPILRKVALVAIHSVYTLPGHPEFIWGSIQHVNTKEIDPDPLTYAGVSILGRPDTSPSSTGPGGVTQLPTRGNPPEGLAIPVDSQNSYLMYSAKTLQSAANTPFADKVTLPDGGTKSGYEFDEPSQSFTNGGDFTTGQVTAAYRTFPGSKSNDLAPDGAIFSLNSNLNTLFANAIASGAIDKNDARQNYRIVAAVWMDKPRLFTLGAVDPTSGRFLGATFQNDATSPLITAAQMGDPMATVSQGVTCGTPQGTSPMSGDEPNATGLNNTVPGCDTRADDLHLKTAINPSIASEPDGGPIDPLNDYTVADPPTTGTDSPFSILGGEDRLSSTTMETFTQNDNFHNCFTCHNTEPINANGTAQDPTCLVPNPPTICAQTTIPIAAKINVSHMFSEFILGETEAQARQAARAGM